jgi:hypothetical protein
MILSSLSWWPSEPIDVRLWACAALFIPGLQPPGCTKQLNRVQSRLGFRLGPPAAGALACALENHAFPTSALQSDASTLRRAVAVRCRLDVRAAAGQELAAGGRVPAGLLAGRHRPRGLGGPPLHRQLGGPGPRLHPRDRGVPRIRGPGSGGGGCCRGPQRARVGPATGPRKPA